MQKLKKLKITFSSLIMLWLDFSVIFKNAQSFTLYLSHAHSYNFCSCYCCCNCYEQNTQIISFINKGSTHQTPVKYHYELTNWLSWSNLMLTVAEAQAALLPYSTKRVQ